MKNVVFPKCFIVPSENKVVYTYLLTTPSQISA
jgi:hypothetical protein